MTFVVLNQATAVTTTCGDWKTAHPETTIMAEDGGIDRRTRSTRCGAAMTAPSSRSATSTVAPTPQAARPLGSTGTRRQVRPLGTQFGDLLQLGHDALARVGDGQRVGGPGHTHVQQPPLVLCRRPGVGCVH